MVVKRIQGVTDVQSSRRSPVHESRGELPDGPPAARVHMRRISPNPSRDPGQDQIASAVGAESCQTRPDDGQLKAARAQRATCLGSSLSGSLGGMLAMVARHHISRVLVAVVLSLLMALPANAGYANETDQSTQSRERSRDREQASDEDTASDESGEDSEAEATPEGSEATDDQATGDESESADQAGATEQTDATETTSGQDDAGGQDKGDESEDAHGRGARGKVPRPPKHVVDDDGDPSTDGYYAGEAIVRLRKRLTIEAFNDRHGTALIASIPSRNLYLVRLPEGRNAVEVEQELEADAGTIWTELNYANGAPEGRPGYFFTSRGDEDDPAASYAPELIGAGEAQRCATGAGVVVAVLDTGVDPSHPLLQGHVLTGWNALDDSGDTLDRGNGVDDNDNGYTDEMTGHGTHVAGIVAQVAPDAAILPVKVLDSDGSGDAFLLAAGIYYALDQGARVINLSLGSTYDARVIEDAVGVAANAGVVVVAAAGNADRAEPLEHPAADRGAVAVAATDADDRKTSFSNYGSVVKLSAPGEGITSAFAGGGEATWSGTSMAAPFVSGAAALLVAAHPEWDGSAVVGRLRQSAADIDSLNPDYTNELGTGRLDVAAAVGCEG
jgi:subtilisin family serine protease